MLKSINNISVIFIMMTFLCDRPLSISSHKSFMSYLIGVRRCLPLFSIHTIRLRSWRSFSITRLLILIRHIFHYRSTIGSETTCYSFLIILWRSLWNTCIHTIVLVFNCLLSTLRNLHFRWKVIVQTALITF